MTIPKPRRVVVACYVFTAFILFTVILSVSNLLHGIAIIASILWLLLLTAVFWIFCNVKGIRNVMIDLLGSFATKHFAESVLEGQGPRRIRFGYQILGRRCFYVEIPVDKIETVEWSTGQASDLAGRDVNDWTVFLWYDHDSPATSQKRQGTRQPDQDIYAVGPSQRKEVTAALGHSLLDFLRQAGASLVPGENESSFVRKGAEKKRDLTAGLEY